MISFYLVICVITRITDSRMIIWNSKHDPLQINFIQLRFIVPLTVAWLSARVIGGWDLAVEGQCDDVSIMVEGWVKVSPFRYGVDLKLWKRFRHHSMLIQPGRRAGSFNPSSKEDQHLALPTRWLLNDYTMFSETFSFRAFFPFKMWNELNMHIKKSLRIYEHSLAKNFSVSQWIKVSEWGEWCECLVVVGASDWWFRCAKYKKASWI